MIKFKLFISHDEARLMCADKPVLHLSKMTTGWTIIAYGVAVNLFGGWKTSVETMEQGVIKMKEFAYNLCNAVGQKCNLVVTHIKEQNG